jgi:hypothetical protein
MDSHALVLKKRDERKFISLSSKSSIIGFALLSTLCGIIIKLHKSLSPNAEIVRSYLLLSVLRRNIWLFGVFAELYSLLVLPLFLVPFLTEVVTLYMVCFMLIMAKELGNA